MGNQTHKLGKAMAMPQNQDSLLSQMKLHFESNKDIKEERANLTDRRSNDNRR